MSFFFGVHADINYTKVTRNIKTPLYLSSTVISNIVDSTKTTLVGAGGIISLNYHFTLLIGIELVADYSFLFEPFSITRILEGREEISGARVSYTIIDNKNKSGIKQRGHTFTIKLALRFGF